LEVEEVEEVEKVENVQSTDIEICCQSQESTIRELQASRRELFVQLAHKTYEPAREKAEERG
jgi:hypothetical protein